MTEAIQKALLELLFNATEDVTFKYDNLIWVVCYSESELVYNFKTNHLGRVVEYIGEEGIRVYYDNDTTADINLVHAMEKNEVFFVEPKGNVLHGLLTLEYDVEYLLHFTPLENLPGIMQNGICPRNMIDNATVTDDYRLDNQTDTSSFSISFPNYKMLWHKKKTMPDTIFIILVIDIDVMLGIEKRKMAFCVHNAARNDVKDRSFDERSLIGNIGSMFRDNKDRVREIYNLPKNYPTDPQAEVLIKDVVPPIFIKEIHVENDEAYKAVMQLEIKDLPPVKIDRQFFQARRDCEYWRRQ